MSFIDVDVSESQYLLKHILHLWKTFYIIQQWNQFYQLSSIE